jgi:hypothetical protein
VHFDRFIPDLEHEPAINPFEDLTEERVALGLGLLESNRLGHKMLIVPAASNLEPVTFLELREVVESSEFGLARDHDLEVRVTLAEDESVVGQPCEPSFHLVAAVVSVGLAGEDARQQQQLALEPLHMANFVHGLQRIGEQVLFGGNPQLETSLTLLIRGHDANLDGVDHDGVEKPARCARGPP